MHESGIAFVVFDDDADVGAIASIIMSGDADNVAIAEMFFYASHFGFRNHADFHGGDFLLRFCHE